MITNSKLLNLNSKQGIMYFAGLGSFYIFEKVSGLLESYFPDIIPHFSIPDFIIIGFIILGLVLYLNERKKTKEPQDSFNAEEYSKYLNKLMDVLDQYIEDKSKPNYFEAIRKMKNEKILLLEHMITYRPQTPSEPFFYTNFRIIYLSYVELAKIGREIYDSFYQMLREFNSTKFWLPNSENWINWIELQHSLGYNTKEQGLGIDWAAAWLYNLNSMIDITTFKVFEPSIKYDEEKKEYMIMDKEIKLAGSKSKEAIEALLDIIKKYNEKIHKLTLDIDMGRSVLEHIDIVKFNREFSDVYHTIRNGKPIVGACRGCIEFFVGKEKENYKKYLDYYKLNSSLVYDLLYEPEAPKTPKLDQ